MGSLSIVHVLIQRHVSSRLRESGSGRHSWRFQDEHGYKEPTSMQDIVSAGMDLQDRGDWQSCARFLAASPFHRLLLKGALDKSSSTLLT